MRINYKSILHVLEKNRYGIINTKNFKNHIDFGNKNQIMAHN